METAERNRPWADGDGYDRYIQEELRSFRKDAWKKQLGGHFNGSSGLQILDLGCGPGFFSCILSEMGHRVTGVDYSEGMLACARANAHKLGADPVFRQMDINFLDFPDACFDAVVSRNVTWTLEHPREVYREMLRVLKPGGTLLIYDANWHLHFFDDALLEKVQARERRCYEKYGREEVVAVCDMEYFASAPLTSTMRPQWDIQTFRELGQDPAVTEDIGQHLYEDWEKDLYGESPLFEICVVRR